MLEPLTRTTFEGHLHTTFQIPVQDADPLDLELVEVNDKTPEGFPGEQFSLIFRGPSEFYLAQRTYPMAHAELGELVLFLVPVDQKKDGYRYEAFFNNSRRDDEE